LIVYVVNRTTLLKDGNVGPVVDAIQEQVSNHLFPAWGVGASLHFITGGEAPPPDAWVVQLVDEANEPGALGFHEDQDRPAGTVGVKTAMDDGVAWSSVLSHEVCELVLDSLATQCIQVGNKVYSMECSDPVEDSDPTYLVNGVLLENFVYPAWFRPGSLGPWDHRRVLTGPLQLSPGGYIQLADLGPWAQTDGELTRASKRRVAGSSRRGRRLIRAGVLP
jgi:hypothetical protein